MRSRRFVTAWSLAAAVACAPSPARAARYTLEQLLAKVKAEYPGVQAAREQLASADAQVSQANRLWWPQGEITLGLTGSPEVHCYGPPDANGNALPDTTNCVRTDVTDLRTNSNLTAALPIHGVALQLNAKLTQPLYTFGKISAAIDAAHAGRKAAEGGVDAARAEVALNAARAYWGLKWSRASRATLADGRDKISEWVDKIGKELDAGKSAFTVADLARLKIALDNVELGILDVERAQRIALAAVRTLTGESDADVDENELDTVELTEQPASYYEDAARTHRPEARMLDAGVTALKALGSLRLAEMLPDVGLVTSFTYGYAQSVDNPSNAFMSHPNTLGAGLYLAFRLPLDIPERLARLSQARADQRAFEAKRREALGGIGLEIDRAWADARAARDREVRTAHGEKVARGWYNAVDQNLQIGTAESKDLVDAARAYFEMRLSHLQSIMDLNVAVAALRRAAGLD